MESVTCPHCGAVVRRGNFCSRCSGKLVEVCDCWVKKKAYNCGRDECPGIRLHRLEIEDLCGTRIFKEKDFLRMKFFLQKQRKIPSPRNRICGRSVICSKRTEQRRRMRIAFCDGQSTRCKRIGGWIGRCYFLSAAQGDLSERLPVFCSHIFSE